MTRRIPLDGNDIVQFDDPMDQFNLDGLAALDARLYHGHRERIAVVVSRDCGVRIVVEVWVEVER